MKKLFVLLLLVGCEKADDRPHREQAFGWCEEEGKSEGPLFMYAVGLGGPKDKRTTKPFVTTEAALQRIEQDGCYAKERQPDMSIVVFACCPKGTR